MVMNLKAVYKYQMNEYKKSVLIYYLVFVLGSLFLNTLITLANSSSTVNSNGQEFATFIFIFVVGLNCFKESFLMLLQNGISRKTMFVARIITSLVLCAGMALIDRILNALDSLINRAGGRVVLNGIYEIAFMKRAEGEGWLIKNVEGFFVAFGFYLAAFAVGYLITIAYYRMNKALKVTISVSVPVTLFVVLPFVDSTLTKGSIFKAIVKVLDFPFKAGNGGPGILLLILLAGFALFFAFSWLLMRNAVDKN
jgi:hypothetical protein